MGPLDIRLTLKQRHRVLGQRHGERRFRNTWTVAHLRYEQVVACQQRFLQRTRRNDVVLEEEQVDEVDGHQCKYDGVDPRHDELRGAFGFLPPLPLDFLGDIDVVDEWYDQ